MSRITLRSFVKINLSIDVGKCGDNGYHAVDMVMQQLSFHDDVTVEYSPSREPEKKGDGAASPGRSGSFDIKITTNRYYLPTDRRNLAYQAAELMIGEAAGKGIIPGRISIDIRKRIPVAGGLAGGSGNGAAVLHALNILWDLELPLDRLMELGAELGSDVPFCVMGQASADTQIPDYLKKDRMASSCARARGRGTDLTVVPPLKAWVVIAKPAFSVSTKEVYQGIDSMEIQARPDNDRLVKMISESAAKSRSGAAKPGKNMYSEFVNVLEAYTLAEYPAVKELKDQMKAAGAEFALMSGSGPTVFGIFRSIAAAKQATQELQNSGVEAYWTKTTL